MVATARKQIIERIIDVEGGYVDDPSDSGGETKFGITKSVARRYGYKGDMQVLPREIAVKIYTEKYWQPLMLDDIWILSAEIAAEMMDMSVHMGQRRAGEFMQRCLNVLNNRGKDYADLKVDGDIGSRTFGAFRAFIFKRGDLGEKVLLKMLNGLRWSFYITLAERREKDERFIFGWLNRGK